MINWLMLSYFTLDKETKTEIFDSKRNREESCDIGFLVSYYILIILLHFNYIKVDTFAETGMRLPQTTLNKKENIYTWKGTHL